MNTLKRFVFCAILLCATLVLKAQTPEWQWAVSAGGSSEDGFGSMAADNQGNQYVTGSFYGTATFGPFTLTAIGFWNIFVAKLDPSGNWLWAVKANGTYSGDGSGIAVDDSGNAYITGELGGTATFGPTTITSIGSHDIFAAKLDPSGNWLWAEVAGGPGGDWGADIAVDSTGSCYLTGSFNSTAVFGSHSITATGYYNIFAAKLDPAGNWLWAVGAGGTVEDFGRHIELDSLGNTFLTGECSGTCSFGTYTFQGSGGYVAKLDSAGNWLWAFNAGSGSPAIAMDSEGNAYLSGDYYGTTDFGPYTLTGSGVYTAKLHSTGNWLWAVNSIIFDTPGAWSPGIDLVLDNLDNIYLCGYFYGTASIGSFTLISNGSSDVLVAKLNTAGLCLWAISTGGASNEDCLNITLDNEGNAYLSGEIEGTATIGPFTLTSHGEADVFIAKLGSTTPVDDDLVPETAALSCLYNAYPNPFLQGETINIKTAIAERETGTLSLFNLRGQYVASHALGAGTQHSTFSSRGLPSGIYLYQLRTKNYSETKKLVLLK